MPNHGSCHSRRRLTYSLSVLSVLACAVGATLYLALSDEDYYSTTVSLAAVAYLDDTRACVVGEAVDGDDRFTSGIIDITSSAGAGWRRTQAGGWAPNAVAFANAEAGWVATTPVGSGDTIILATTDGGRTWSTQSSGTRCLLRGIACVDERRCWVVGESWTGESGVILATVNGGLTWEGQWRGDIGLDAVAFADVSHGWAVGNGVVVTTSDGGATWRESGPRRAAPILYGVACTDANHVWVCGEGRRGGGVILHSRNGGVTWEVQYSVDSGVIGCVTFVDDEQGWAVGSREFGGLILHTSDGGQTWTQQDTRAMAPLDAVAFSDPLHGMAVGNAYVDRGPQVTHEGSLILITSNGGVTWETTN